MKPDILNVRKVDKVINSPDILLWQWSVIESDTVAGSDKIVIFSLAEMADEDKSVETLIKTIKELPQPNKDTLAFLMLHLQR